MTLDAGGLIAVERDYERVMSLVRTARRHGEAVVVPAVVLAQAWRSPRNARLAQLLALCSIEPFTEERARRVGELLARSGTGDIVDAAVVLSAAARGDAVVTSDPGDMARLSGLLASARLRIVTV